MNNEREIEFRTETLCGSSSELVLLSGNEVELFTRSQLMVNKARLMNDNEVTVVCQVSLGWLFNVNISFDFLSLLKINFDGEESEKIVSTKQNQLEQMLQDKTFTDVKIITPEGNVIKAHKFVLARSPVFLAMFKSEMKEKQSSEVHVKNFNYHEMRDMIQFMYTDKVEHLDSIAAELLGVADYYDLPELKQICLKWLQENVNLTNFAQTLFTAERFQIQSLREAVLRFVVTWVLVVMF